VKFIEEQKGDSIEEPYPSRKQQTKQQDGVSLQQGETQRHEIAGIVEEHLPSSSENVMGTMEKFRNHKPRQE
jgi:hypothetical protein